MIPLLLHGRHGRPGAPEVLYQPFGNWLVPWRFGEFEQDYQALRTTAGLLDVSTLALVECRGADRVDFLHRLLTHDIKALTPGTGCRAALLSAHGRLLADLLVLADADALWLLCPLPRASLVADTLERYRFSEQVTWVNHERSQAALGVQGPRTAEVVSRAFGPIPALEHPGDHALIVWQGMSIRLVSHTLAGDLGLLCLVPAEHALSVWQALVTTGALLGARPVGWEALNAARIEAGLPWEADLADEPLLPETGLEAVAVSDTKGCYVGQEIVARVATYGSVSRRLVRLAVDGDTVPQAGDVIRHEGAEAGRVTSAGWSPARRRPLAFAYVKRSAYEPGTRVEIAREEQPLPAVIIGGRE